MSSPDKVPQEGQESHTKDPEKIPATKESKEQFYDLAHELIYDCRFYDPPGYLGDEYFKEGYVLDDGRLVWITLSPPRTRDNVIKGQMRSNEAMRLKGSAPRSKQQIMRYVDEKVWYDGKPEGEDGVLIAYVEIEKGEQVEKYSLRSSGKFSRTYFPGHSEEGKTILDEYGKIAPERIANILTGEKPINDPVIDKYVDYFYSQWEAAEEMEEMGFTAMTEAEAQKINSMLKYLMGDKDAHLMNGVEFYQRIVDENPEHLFTEDNPEYLPYRKALEELKRLKGEQEE